MILLLPISNHIGSKVIRKWNFGTYATKKTVSNDISTVVTKICVMKMEFVKKPKFNNNNNKGLNSLVKSQIILSAMDLLYTGTIYMCMSNTVA